MKKFLSTVAVGALALAGPVLAQETTTGTSTTQMTPTSSAMICGPSTASTTTTDTTASTSTATGTSTGTDTTASTTGTSTDTTASTGADTTTGTAGTSTDTTASTTGTAAGTSGASTTTLGLSADNQMIEQSARTALSNVDANLGKLAGFTPDVICLVDLNIVSTAQAESTLKSDVSKFEANKAQIKSTLEGNTQLLDKIKAQHPTFDVNQVIATDVGPNGELFLYVWRS